MYQKNLFPTDLILGRGCGLLDGLYPLHRDDNLLLLCRRAGGPLLKTHLTLSSLWEPSIAEYVSVPQKKEHNVIKTAGRLTGASGGGVGSTGGRAGKGDLAPAPPVWLPDPLMDPYAAQTAALASSPSPSDPAMP
jgi:hypothetical protein